MRERLAAGAAPSGATAHVGGHAEIPAEDAGQPASVVDGTLDQERVIQQALGAARKMAAQGLAVLQAGPQTDRERRMVEAHFHTSDSTLLARAATVLSQVQAGLSGPIPIQVEGFDLPLGDRASGYVYGGPFAEASDIHLMPRFFDRSVDEQGGTLIHEASHKYAGTRDHAYAGPGDYQDLTPELAMENADSYATFCELRQEDMRADEAERRAAEGAEAARTHAEEVWTAWEAGKLRYGEDPFMTSAGVEIPIGLVKGIILERFAERHPDRRGDIVSHLEAKRGYSAVTCRDGYVAPELLVRAIGEEEAM